METRQQKRAATKHVRKFMDGRMTPQELHRKLGWPPGATCFGCKSPKVAIRIRTLADVAEMRKRDPHFNLLATIDPAGLAQTIIPTRYGTNMVKVRELFACDHCAPAAERAAAKHPDWCIVDINRGPKDPAPSVGWTGSTG